MLAVLHRHRLQLLAVLEIHLQSFCLELLLHLLLAEAVEMDTQALLLLAALVEELGQTELLELELLVKEIQEAHLTATTPLHTEAEAEAELALLEVSVVIPLALEALELLGSMAWFMAVAAAAELTQEVAELVALAEVALAELDQVHHLWLPMDHLQPPIQEAEAEELVTMQHQALEVLEDQA